MPAAVSELELIEQYGDAQLDTILALPEPERTRAIEAFVTAGSMSEDGGLVKLVTNDGRPLETDYVDRRGKRLTITGQGRRVSRLLAIDLLMKYGADGQYVGKCQASGHTPQSWALYRKREPELAASLVEQLGGEPRFIRNRLTHAVTGAAPAASGEGLVRLVRDVAPEPEPEDEEVAGDDE